MSEPEPILYCANHPHIETTLRCSRCEKPICAKCAVLTPTGYRCKECVRGQQKVFNTAQWYDYLSAFIVSSILSYIGSRIVPALGFFTIFIAPIAGVIIAEIIRFTVRRRRSKQLFQLTAAATALGSLPLLLLIAISTLSLISRGGLGLLLSLVWQGLYTFTVTSTVYYRLAGINVRT
jgi:hypothetical protein